MKKIIITLALAVLVSGCATAQRESAQRAAPPMPNFQTDNGKALAKKCQIYHTQCLDNCDIHIDQALRNIAPRGQCLNTCNQRLGDCYKTCE